MLQGVLPLTFDLTRKFANASTTIAITLCETLVSAHLPSPSLYQSFETQEIDL